MEQEEETRTLLEVVSFYAAVQCMFIAYQNFRQISKTFDHEGSKLPEVKPFIKADMFNIDQHTFDSIAGQFS